MMNNRHKKSPATLVIKKKNQKQDNYFKFTKLVLEHKYI